MIQNILDQEYISTVIPAKDNTGKHLLFPCKYSDDIDNTNIEFEETNYKTTVNEERSKLICISNDITKELKIVVYVILWLSVGI